MTKEEEEEEEEENNKTKQNKTKKKKNKQKKNKQKNKQTNNQKKKKKKKTGKSLDSIVANLSKEVLLLWLCFLSFDPHFLFEHNLGKVFLPDFGLIYIFLFIVCSFTYLR